MWGESEAEVRVRKHLASMFIGQLQIEDEVKEEREYMFNYLRACMGG